jgi:hypothetical protein
MYAKSGAYKNLKSTKMNTKNTTQNFKLLAVGIVAISFFVTSCTSLQQTTVVASDDLYYTPSKPAEQVVAQAEEETYQDYQNYQDDRYLRLKVANRNRWSSIDDFGYWNNPSFSMGFGMGYGGFGGFGYGGGWDPFWNNRFGWAGYYGGFGGFGYGGFGGFGYDPFWGGGFGGFGYDPFWGGGFSRFGYGGFGGFGYGGFGYGGWNPYYASMWNPYGNYYQNGGIYGGGYGAGIPMNVTNYDKRVPVQPNRTNLNPYMKNIGQFRRVGDVRENGNFANSNSNGNVGARSNTPAGFRSINSNSASSNNVGTGFSRANSNNYSNSNSTQPSVSSFGSLVKRVMTTTSSTRAASFNNSSKKYSAPNNNSSNSYQNSTPNKNTSTPSYSAPASSGSSSSGSSSGGGGGFIGGGRTKTGGGN